MSVFRSLSILICVFAFVVAATGQTPSVPRQQQAVELTSLIGKEQQGVFADVSHGGKKSPALAVLYSLVVPGLGEYYAGNFTTGRYFLGAEGLLWLAYGGFTIHAASLRDNGRSYAAIHSGAQIAGKNDQFFVNIGNFMTTAEYNAKKMRDREPDLVYDESAGYAWSWDSDANRMTFRDMRVRSDNAYNNRKFIVAAVLVNHLASAINAARAVIVQNKALAAVLGDVSIQSTLTGSVGNPDGVCITLSRSF